MSKRTITIELDMSPEDRMSSVAEELIGQIKASHYLGYFVTGLRFTDQGDTVRTVPGAFERSAS